jgi:tryptophan-rich sensory protein
MVDERRPTKKVVKKVVKKTVVVRPAQTGSTKVRPAAPKAGTPLAKLRAKASRPSIRIPSPPRRPGAGLAARARLAGSRVGDRGRDASFAAKRRVRSSVGWLRDLRLPRLSPMRAAAITGLVAGLLAVALGYLSYELFSATRGTTAGGAWGAIVLVVVAFVTFAAGELLLGGFGVDHGRFISAMSIMLVLVFILTFFLELAAGPAAWILIPVLGMIAFMASGRVALIAADQPNRR